MHVQEAEAETKELPKTAEPPQELHKTKMEGASKLMPIMVELNQDNAQRALSEEMPKDWDKEAIKVPEKTPSTAGEELHRKSDSTDARADIRRRAREAAVNKLTKNQPAKNPQLDEAKERTPCTSAAVKETEQRRTPSLAEKLLAENTQMALARKKTDDKAREKRAPDEPKELEENPKVVNTMGQKRTCHSTAPPP